MPTVPSNLDNYKNNKKKRLEQNSFKEGYVAGTPERTVEEQLGDVIISSPIVVQRNIYPVGITVIQNLIPNETFADGDLLSLSTIDRAPMSGSFVTLYVNGLMLPQADGPGASPTSLFFVTSSDGLTVRAIGDAQIGDQLRWNGSVAEYEIISDDEIFITYEI